MVKKHEKRKNFKFQEKFTKNDLLLLIFHYNYNNEMKIKSKGLFFQKITL